MDILYNYNVADYPDWVLKYKKKGKLVQERKDDLY
jgi:hypothetical protein